jgi:hypothetical protein
LEVGALLWKMMGMNEKVKGTTSDYTSQNNLEWKA